LRGFKLTATAKIHGLTGLRAFLHPIQASESQWQLFDLNETITLNRAFHHEAQLLSRSNQRQAGERHERHCGKGLLLFNRTGLLASIVASR